MTGDFHALGALCGSGIPSLALNGACLTGLVVTEPGFHESIAVYMMQSCLGRTTSD